MVASIVIEASEELKSRVRTYWRSAFQRTQKFIRAKWLLEEESELLEDDDYYEDKNLENIIFTVDFKESLDRRQFLSMLAVDEREILEIGEATVGQFKNPQFCILRKFRLTSSNFGVILSAAKRNKYPPSLYNRLLGPTIWKRLAGKIMY